MTREIKDWDNLSKEDEAFLRMRGNPVDLQRAGLLPKPDFDLSGTPGSIPEHELKGEGEPVNDMDSKIAEASEGSEPGGDPVVTRVPDPVPPAPVSAQAKAESKAAATPKASEKAKA